MRCQTMQVLHSAEVVVEHISATEQHLVVRVRDETSFKLAMWSANTTPPRMLHCAVDIRGEHWVNKSNLTHDFYPQGTLRGRRFRTELT